MAKPSFKSPRLAVLSTLAVLTVAFSVIACGSDPTATPAPTPTPAPTATPVPTPTTAPAATPTSPPPEAGGGAASLIVTSATTGQDLVDALTTEEQDCIRDTFGEAVFNLMLQMPLAQAGGDPSAAAPLYGCLSEENTIHVAVAFMSFGSGGWTPDTVACITDVAMNHPAIITDSMGITNLPTEPADAVAKHRHNVLMYECFTIEERVLNFSRSQLLFDSLANLDDSLLSLLPQSETDCIRNVLSDEEFAVLPELTLLSAFEGPSGETLSGCISDESFVKSFMFLNEILLGGSMSDGTRACLVEFGNNHPLYVQAAKLGYYDFQSIPLDEYSELADDGFRVYDCLTDEELLTMQNTITSAMMQAP